MVIYIAEPGSSSTTRWTCSRLGATLDQAEAANVVDGL
jgi:hypothetical protein